MSTPLVNDFDHWIRTRFVDINTELEHRYFAQQRREEVSHVGDDLKTSLLEESGEFIRLLLGEGNTDEGFDSGFDLLGNVGFVLAACRRHEIDEHHSTLKNASALAMQLGASLGVVPRFASAH